MGREESNQTNKQTNAQKFCLSGHIVCCIFPEKIEMVKSKWGLALSAIVTVVSSLCMSVSICSQLGLNSRLNGG